MSEEKIGGIMIPFCILDCEPLTVCEKLVWSYLFAFQVNGARCFAGVGTIAKKLGFSEISIKRAVASLKKHKLLAKGTWTTPTGNAVIAYHCLSISHVPQACKVIGEYQNDTTDSKEYQNDTSEGIKMIPTEYQNDTHNNNTNNKLKKKAPSSTKNNQDILKNQGIETTNTLLTKDGSPKLTEPQVECSAKNPTDLPRAKVLRFEGEGKEEMIENVWLDRIQYGKLVTEFGEETVFAALKAAHTWSVNEDPYKGKPAYKAWHEKTNHYQTIRKLITRELSYGKVAALGYAGYEFIKKDFQGVAK